MSIQPFCIAEFFEKFIYLAFKYQNLNDALTALKVKNRFYNNIFMNIVLFKTYICSWNKIPTGNTQKNNSICINLMLMKLSTDEYIDNDKNYKTG